jgi:hypothetical protein
LVSWTSPFGEVSSRASFVADLIIVEDGVTIALLGQEKLALGGEFLVPSIPGDQGVEVSLPPIGLGA